MCLLLGYLRNLSLVEWSLLWLAQRYERYVSMTSVEPRNSRVPVFFQLRAISFKRSSSRKFRDHRVAAEAGIDRSASVPTSKASDPTRPRRRRRRQRRSSSRRMSPNWPSARKLKLKVVRKKFPKFSKEVVRGRKKFSLQPQVQTSVGQNKS